MRKQPVILAVAALAIGAAVFGSLNTQASGNPSQDATLAATKYLNAIKEGNAAEAVKYVEDVRFKNDAEAIQGYQDLLKNDPVSEAKIVSTQVVDAKHANVSIQFTSHFAGTQSLVLPVEKKGDTWKVEMTHIKAVKPNK